MLYHFQIIGIVSVLLFYSMLPKAFFGAIYAYGRMGSMKKVRSTPFILAALLIAGVLAVLPAPQEAKAATAPQIIQVTTPTGSTLADRWHGVVSITFDQPVQASGAHDAGAQIILNWKYRNPSTMLMEDQPIWWDYSDGSLNGDITISADGLTVTFDMGYYALDYIEGDKLNRYGNNYKYQYWLHLSAGAFVLRDNPAIAAEGWADEYYTVYVQSLPPQIIWTYPAFDAAHVVASAGTQFSITFNENVYKNTGAPVIYQYDASVTSWADAPKWVCSTCSTSGNVLTFQVPDSLPNNKIFGIMIPGPANDTPYSSNVNFMYNSISTPFPGIDMPPGYVLLPCAGCWSFTTATTYVAPSMTSHTPTSGALHVDPHGSLAITFDQNVRSVTGSSKYVYIKKYSDDSAVKQILNTDILAAGSYASIITVPDQSLDKNTQYYVTVDAGAFENYDGIDYAGLTDKSWYFTTIETYEVKFYTDGTQYGATQTVDYNTAATTPSPAPAKPGYVFDGWDKDYSHVTSNLNVNAVLKQLFTLSYSAGEHGSITGTSPQEVAEGDDGAAVTAVADTVNHYHFVQWSDGNTNATRTDTNVSGNIDVTAYFAIDTFSLDYDTTAGGTLSASGLTGLSSYHESVDYGGDGTTVTAVPNTGYNFVKWSDNVLTPSRTGTNVQENIDVTAQFAANTYTVTYLADSGGTITGTSPQTIPYGGSGTQVTAVAPPNYHFKQWSDGVTTASRTDTNPEGLTGSITVTAQFEHDACTLTYIAGEHGVIDGNAAQTVAYGGNGTQVTATPALGYHFVSWSDGKTTASRTDTGVTSDISVTATFAINTYTLTYTAGSHGALTGDLNQSVVYGGSGTQVIATADERYHFVKWSDGVITSYRTDTNVVKNIDVTAEFAINKYKVTFKDYDGTVLKTQSVEYGSDAAPPEDPEREGYTFNGWDGEYYDVTAAVTITAEYKINAYKVTFVDHDGAELKTQNVTYGMSAVPPADPTREGYVFIGWDGDYTKIKGTVTFTAQYGANKVKVTFVDHDGSVIEEQDVEYGTDAAAPAGPEREGFIFTGWDKEFTGVTEDMTVTAQYKAALTVGQVGDKDGSPAIVVNTGDLDITEVNFEGGTAKVNPDGSLTLKLFDNIKAGDYELKFKLADGTTLTETITITDEDIAAMGTKASEGTPLWLWILLAALAAGAAVLIAIFVRRLRYSR